MSEEVEIFSFDEITDDEFLQIRSIAVKYIRSGYHGGDEMRCIIRAFLDWVITQQKELVACEIINNELLN